MNVHKVTYTRHHTKEMDFFRDPLFFNRSSLFLDLKSQVRLDSSILAQYLRSGYKEWCKHHCLKINGQSRSSLSIDVSALKMIVLRQMWTWILSRNFRVRNLVLPKNYPHQLICQMNFMSLEYLSYPITNEAIDIKMFESIIHLTGHCLKHLVLTIFTPHLTTSDEIQLIKNIQQHSHLLESLVVQGLSYLPVNHLLGGLDSFPHIHTLSLLNDGDKSIGALKNGSKSGKNKGSTGVEGFDEHLVVPVMFTCIPLHCEFIDTLRTSTYCYRPFRGALTVADGDALGQLASLQRKLAGGKWKLGKIVSLSLLQLDAKITVSESILQQVLGVVGDSVKALQMSFENAAITARRAGKENEMGVTACANRVVSAKGSVVSTVLAFRATLRRLTLSGADLTIDAIVTLLRSCTALSYLHCSTVTLDVAQHTLTLKNSNDFGDEHTDVSDTALEQLLTASDSVKQVTYLTINSCPCLSNAGMRHIITHLRSTLTFFVIADCEGVTTTGISYLLQYCRLQLLSVSSCFNVGAHLCESIAKYGSELVSLQWVYALPGTVTEEMLCAIPPTCTKLEVVAISFQKSVSSDGLVALLMKHCPSMQRLLTCSQQFTASTTVKITSTSGGNTDNNSGDASGGSGQRRTRRVKVRCLLTGNETFHIISID